MIILKFFLSLIITGFLLFNLPKFLVFLPKFFLFLKLVIVDFYRLRKEFKKGGVRVFRPFGLKMFCGRQGAGKTMGMAWYLERIRKAYPDCLIVTNFGYVHQHFSFESLDDLFTIRNGEQGVVFAIDELQNEFSSVASRNFPEDILRQITQQRKQRVCILATSQVFTRVAKPLREQCFEVIECKTFLGRWTRLKVYDSEEYNCIVDNPTPEKKFKLPKKFVYSFVQTDELRALYDTYAVIERIGRSITASQAKSDDC